MYWFSLIGSHIYIGELNTPYPVFINRTPYMFQACDRAYSPITRHVDFTRAVTACEVFSLRPGLRYRSKLLAYILLSRIPSGKIRTMVGHAN